MVSNILRKNLLIDIIKKNIFEKLKTSLKTELR